jgi:hypothetical protein
LFIIGTHIYKSFNSGLKHYNLSDKMSLYVLLYSKYSTVSNELLNTLETSPVNLTSVIGLQYVCVDNKEIRQQIEESADITVSTVPCILIMYSNKTVEQYEGAQLAAWVEQTVENYRPPVDRAEPRGQEVQSLGDTPAPVDLGHEDASEAQEEVSRKPRKKHRREQPDSSSSEDDEDEYERKQRKKRKKKRKDREQIKPDEMTGKPNDVNIERPLASIRTGPSAYELTSDFGAIQDQDAQTAPKATKGHDLMSVAMAMQKERESTESKSSKR